MHLGFGLPVAGSWATPANVRTVAERAEKLGYATLWSFQRVLVGSDQDLAPTYHSVADPLLPLAFAAATTTRIRLASAIVNMPFYGPAVLAKQFATLDVLSGGRAVAGLGLGWSAEEFTAAGVPYAHRGARGEEYLTALRACWGPDPVTHAGAFYSIPPASIRPKPVQERLPVLLGGTAPAALARAGRLADGWISSSRTDLTQIGHSIATVRAAASTAGRDPGRLEFVCRGVLVEAPRTRPLTGSFAEVRADLAYLAAQGVTELFLDLNFDPAIGDPEADPSRSMQRALEVLERLAP